MIDDPRILISIKKKENPVTNNTLELPGKHMPPMQNVNINQLINMIENKNIKLKIPAEIETDNSNHKISNNTNLNLIDSKVTSQYADKIVNKTINNLRVSGCCGALTPKNYSASVKESLNKDSLSKSTELDLENDGDDGENDFKKRRRKSNGQLKILKNELENEDSWSKEKISKVSKMTGLSESQVYKWCWDQKKKKVDDSVKKLIKGTTNATPVKKNLQSFDSIVNNCGGNVYKDFYNPSFENNDGKNHENKENFVALDLVRETKPISKIPFGLTKVPFGQSKVPFGSKSSNIILQQKNILGNNCSNMMDIENMNSNLTNQLKRDPMVYKHSGFIPKMGVPHSVACERVDYGQQRVTVRRSKNMMRGPSSGGIFSQNF